MDWREFEERWPKYMADDAGFDHWGLARSNGRVFLWSTIPQCSGDHLRQMLQRKAADGNATAQRALELVALDALLR